MAQPIAILLISSVLLFGCAYAQQEYDGMFFMDDETGIMEFIPGPIEIDDIIDPVAGAKAAGGNSGCYKCMDYFCEGKPCRDYDCRRCTGYKYECKKKCPPSQKCPDCVCKVTCPNCPDCTCNPKLTCGNNTVVSPSETRCEIKRNNIPQCTTGQGSVDHIVSFNVQSPSGATVVPAITSGRRELIHLIYNGTFCTGRNAANPATLNFFNGGTVALVSKTIACPSNNGVAQNCCIDLCEVDTFQGVDLIQQNGSPVLTVTATGGTYTGTMTAGTCS